VTNTTENTVEGALDALDPAATSAQDASDLRTIAELVDARQTLDDQLERAIAAARRNGKSWGKIAIALGMSR
jgi:hypothetical protein